jgi:hypothetical protein
MVDIAQARTQGRVNADYPAIMRRKQPKRYKHRMVAEQALGRPLPARAQIHHIDEDKRNFRNDNLVICQDDAYHKLLHQRLRAYRTCGNANWLLCVLCHCYDRPEAMKVYGRNWFVHPFCAAKMTYERRHGLGTYEAFLQRKGRV